MWAECPMMSDRLIGKEYFVKEVIVMISNNDNNNG